MANTRLSDIARRIIIGGNTIEASMIVHEIRPGQAIHTSLSKISLADIKYPHKCFKCKRALYWTELLESNPNMNRLQLAKLWKSKYVQFYCCSCYTDHKNTEEIFLE